MNITQSFGHALKIARTVKNLTQEDFSEISSRTYVSTLERGLYSPTLEKINDLARVIEVHPLTLISLAYLIDVEDAESISLFKRVQKELEQLTMK